jgi:hypothetical protein
MGTEDFRIRVRSPSPPRPRKTARPLDADDDGHSEGAKSDRRTRRREGSTGPCEWYILFVSKEEGSIGDWRASWCAMQTRWVAPFK